MPFDALPARKTGIALLQQRREDAAAFWRQIPPSCFDLKGWQCGTTACAIGWLAVKKHGGWSFCKYGCIPTFGGLYGFAAAMYYFGLSRLDAWLCFAESHPSDPARTIFCYTPADVAKAVLSRPYDEQSVASCATLRQQSPFCHW